MKFFICERYRNWFNKEYVYNYIKEYKPKYYDTYEEADTKLRQNFYDDSSYDVFAVDGLGVIYYTNDCKGYVGMFPYFKGGDAS